MFRKKTDMLDKLPADLLRLLARRYLNGMVFILKLTCQYIRKVLETETTTMQLTEVVATIRLLEFSRKRGCPWNSKLCTAAVYQKRRDILLYLAKQNIFGDLKTFEVAVVYADIPLLDLLYRQCVPFGPLVATAAAHANRFKILKWLRAKRCEFGVDVLNEAVRNENMEMILWLHHKNYPKGFNAIYFALLNNNLELAKWLYHIGCPFDREGLLHMEALSAEIIHWLEVGYRD